MSKTKEQIIPEETVKKLKYLSKKFKQLNTGNKSREFWMVSDDGQSEGYEWDQFDVGINDSGELITCSQSGCSCNSPENPEADTKIVLTGEIKIRPDNYSVYETWLPELIEITAVLYGIFKTGKFEAKDIIGLPNAEIRRAVIEYVGLEKFIKKAKPEVLDESSFGKLVKINVPDPDEDIVAVYVKDASTTRKYFLRVPPKIKTAREAVAWTFGFSEDEYNPTVQT